MIGAPNSLNFNCKVRVMKEAPGPSVSEEIVDIFTNYNIDYHWSSEIAQEVNSKHNEACLMRRGKS